MSVIPLATRSQHVVFAYDQVVRPHRSYCPSGGLPRGRPRTRHMWICLQLSRARGMDNGGVRANAVMYEAWASANMLILNDNKTELMPVISKRTKHFHNLPTSITIGNAQVPFKQSVKNLGFTLECHLTMNAHVSNIAHTFYFELRCLASICRFLTSTATSTLASAFVLSRVDYCNSLLFGLTHDVISHLQRIQNNAARVILRLPESSSITTHLKSLHWLPVKVRSTYKIACLCYHCHSSTAPSYVTDMLHKKPSHTRNTCSSSYTMPLLNRPAYSKATLGDHSFSFASSVWNSIPKISGVPHHCHHFHCMV